MIVPCDNCKRKHREEQLTRKKGSNLCPRCLHEWRKHYDRKQSDAPDVLKRTTTPEGEVVIVGKDVPHGYQDDPDIITEKMERELTERDKKMLESQKNNKEFWERYNNNENFRKHVDEKWMKLYRKVGAQALRNQGYPEHVIQALTRGGGNNG